MGSSLDPRRTRSTIQGLASCIPWPPHSERNGTVGSWTDDRRCTGRALVFRERWRGQTAEPRTVKKGAQQSGSPAEQSVRPNVTCLRLSEAHNNLHVLFGPLDVALALQTQYDYSIVSLDAIEEIFDRCWRRAVLRLREGVGVRVDKD